MCHFFWPCRDLSCFLKAVPVHLHPALPSSRLNKSGAMPKHGPRKAGDEVKAVDTMDRPVAIGCTSFAVVRPACFKDKICACWTHTPFTNTALD